MTKQPIESREHNVHRDQRTPNPAPISARGNSPEPIAIIGVGCRFPGGANDAASYWDLLASGTDAISQTPSDRWNLQKFYSPESAKPGKTQSQWGGYVHDLDQFDPGLFGISPREAASMDPQQRLLLEVAYRAMEDAGQPSAKVAGQAVSVFVGISSFDYAVAGLSFRDRGVIDAYSNTGGSSSIAANRISYCFDLRGPSVAVDTACSSSLVALHMACESLGRGEASMALAGGVNALLMPDFYVAFSQLGVLSPDGRCKTFDARANGYVRSEGAGMVLLKPLSAALRDKDPIYAVVRSTALNQDGRTPGMTVPSQVAQESLIRAACDKANIAPADIQYVEAHGTGTPVGDPIEAAAIGAALGKHRRHEHPLFIGSVKTNIGHLEAGAGIASVIKVALALHHRSIPAHLHFDSPNTNIDFDGLNLRVPTTMQPWNSDVPRVAGVNGFGYGGANAHIILEQAPAQAAPVMSQAAVQPGQATRAQALASSVSAVAIDNSSIAAPVLLPLSARNKSALSKVAGELADWIEHNAQYHLAEIAGYLAHRRSHLECRAAAVATSREEMVAELRTLAASTPEELPDEFSASKVAGGVALVCSGQGPQWWAMGRGLLRYSPAFRSVIKRCDTEFSKLGSWSLLEELTRGEAESRMHETSLAQPSIFAIQVALAAVWQSWGVRPTAVVGHSVGEIAAAYLSGSLSWEDACSVAFHRGRTMDLATSQGAMIAAGLSATEATPWMRGLEDRIGVAAINGPTSITISGDAEAIETLAIRLEAAGIFCRRLAVEYAFHSPQMEPVREELLRSLAHIQPRATHTPMISTVTGRAITGVELTNEYWWQNVRQSVRFSDAMQCIADRGIGIAVEIGPHPVLAYSISECFQAAGQSVRSVPSLNRQQDDLSCISNSLGSLFSLGFDLNWDGFYNKPTRKLPLPAYPFQRQRCWSESAESQFTRLASVEHPLLGEPIDGPDRRWQQRVDLKLQSYLADHRVRNTCMYPAAAMIETTLAAAMLVAESNTARLERFRLHGPCMLAENRPQCIETRFDAERSQLQLNCRPADEDTWKPLVTVDVSRSLTGSLPTPETTSSESQSDWHRLQADVTSRCTEYFDAARLYAYCKATGLDYGPRFAGAVRGQRCAGEAVVDIQLDGATLGADASEYGLHPAMLDACFHSILAADPNFDHTVDGLYLPISIREIICHRLPQSTDDGTRTSWTVHTRVVSKTQKLLICDLAIYDAGGKLCLELLAFESQRVAGGQSVESTEDLIYSYAWQPQPLVETDARGTSHWLLFMDEGGVGQELAERLRSRGDRVSEIYRDDSRVPQTKKTDFYQVAPADPVTFQAALSSAVQAARISAEPSAERVVYLWGLDAPHSAALNCENLKSSTALTTLAPLHFVQAWSQLETTSTAELFLVTSGAQSQDGAPECTSVAQAPLIGFGRVVVNESAELHTRLVDLPAEISASDIDCLVSELTTPDDEDEVLWRSGQRFVHRFLPQSGRAASMAAAADMQCRLQVGQSAGVEELHYTTQTCPTLADGQLEIEVAASGLNFSDVMKALDLYPGLPDGPLDLGAECSGRVSRVAPGSAWNVGDEVMAVAPGSFATHVIVNEALVARKPSMLTFEQAAAIPIAFLTAQYALHECARLRTGDSVLIHSASGGVGLAAMQLAKLEGLRVFATAGTDRKRQFVRDQGAEHVMDSRSLKFADEILHATRGQGIDAVLNSLPGEAIRKGLSVLKPGGRFLEIGKRDIYGDQPLGLYPFRNNLALFAIDLDQMFKQQPARMGKMLRELAERFEGGELQPLPTSSYPADETVAAYRFMQQGKHIGKVVVSYAQRPTDIRNGRYASIQFSDEATYWVAGGLGGFGLEISKWLVNRGARHLVLSGRSPTLRPAAEQALQVLQQLGATITVLPADITDPKQIERVLAHIDSELPPLRGVIHTAMVLEDKLLADLDRATLERVLRPKVLGGWNLHAATRSLELDHFVLFSSLSSVFGHAGQANYSAANALLDSLAYYRRAQGLPAIVMNWGHLGEVGYLAEREQLGQRLERQGVLSFSVRQATDCMEYALQNKALQLSVLRMNWNVWRGLGITARVSPKFAHLLRHDHDADGDANQNLSAAQLRGVSPQDRVAHVDRMLRTKAGQLLGIAPSEINSDRALLEMGLDSLMAVELRNWLEARMEIDLQISLLMRSASFAQVTSSLCELIDTRPSLENNVPSTSKPDTTPADSTNMNATEELDAAEATRLLQQLPDLSEGDVARLLGQMLGEQN